MEDSLLSMTALYMESVNSKQLETVTGNLLQLILESTAALTNDVKTGRQFVLLRMFVRLFNRIALSSADEHSTKKLVKEYQVGAILVGRRVCML